MKHLYSGTKIALFLNGKSPISLPKLKIYEKIFITDGAYHLYKKMGYHKIGFQPHVIIGDFDSIEHMHFPKEIEVMTTSDQHFTDFEKSLSILEKKGYKNIDVWGASGKEQDHFLGNISTGLKYKNRLSLIFYDKYHCYFFSSKSIFLKKVMGKKISIFPFPKVQGVSSYGLEFPLSYENLHIGHRIGTRNKATKENISINYRSGNILLFIQIKSRSSSCL